MAESKTAFSIVPSRAHILHSHPESPDRLREIEKLLRTSLSSLVSEQTADPAPLEHIRKVHPTSYIESIRQASKEGPGFLDFGDTYITPATFDAACKAAAALLGVTRAALSEDHRGGIALIRPPGHHATSTQGMGFCIFNNVAIATRYSQSMGMEKVMIVDFDVHHGNGTQALFDDDPDVFLFSTHQWGIFPGTGSLREIGRKGGEGSVLNIPLPARAGDESFALIYDRLLPAAIERFKPDFIFVSAGFDAHWRDPLAQLQLSTSGFFSMSQTLCRLADEYAHGRIVFVLEGGYHPIALAEGVTAIIHALSGRPEPKSTLGPAPYFEPGIESLVAETASIHEL